MSLAPISEKIISIVKKPIILRTPTNTVTSISDPVASTFAFELSPLPKHLPITADAPMPKPIFRLMTVKVTGKVKLMAASSLVPIRLTKKVSTILKVINMTMPKIIGTVILIKVDLISPFSMSLLFIDDCLTFNTVA